MTPAGSITQTYWRNTAPQPRSEWNTKVMLIAQAIRERLRGCREDSGGSDADNADGESIAKRKYAAAIRARASEDGQK